MEHTPTTKEAQSIVVSEHLPSTMQSKYDLIEEIGRGGMAAVYKAVHKITGNLVAIKFLHSQGEVELKRFRQEARTAIGLAHPNIVAVRDFDVSDNTAFLVMEYVEGRSVDQVIKQEGRLEPARAKKIATDVCAALAHAHASGIVHRDIKPSNVMLCSVNGVEMAKLADFGIAKSVSDIPQGLTQTGEIVGTPLYLSPEQCSGRPATQQSDLYALGCLMFEAVSGKPPLVGENFFETIHLRTHQSPPSLREIGFTEVDRDFDQAIAACLKMDPEQRIGSASEVLARLSGEKVEPARKFKLGRFAITMVVLGLILAALTLVSFDVHSHRTDPVNSLNTSVDPNELYAQRNAAQSKGNFEFLETLPAQTSQKDYELDKYILDGSASRITVLNLSDRPTSDLTFKKLRKFPNLHTLIADGVPVTDKDLSGIDKLNKLRILSLKHTPLTDAGLHYVARLSGLKSLDIASTHVTDGGVAALVALINLEQLDLSDNNVSDSGIIVLQQLRQLQMLGLAGTKVTDASARTIHGLEKLEVLSIGDTAITGKTLAALPGSIVKLDLWNCDLADEDLSHLVHLKRLSNLRVPGTRISDAVAETFKALPSLSELGLANTWLTDAGLVEISKIPSIKQLWLRNCHISGDGIEHLGKMSALEAVDLSHTGVTEKGLTALRTLPKLRRIGLNSVQITNGDIAVLQAQMPVCLLETKQWKPAEWTIDKPQISGPL